MFPALEAIAGDDCQQIANKLHGALLGAMGNGADPQTQQMLTKMIAVMQQSCEQDGWPAPLKQCILRSNGTTAGLEACNQQMPPTLQQQLAKRIESAMRR